MISNAPCTITAKDGNSLEIVKNSLYSKDFSVIVGVYSDDGNRLIDVRAINSNEIENKTQITVDLSENRKVRAFVWNNLDEMIPISSVQNIIQ